MAEIKYPIREALKKQGITQDELARKFGKTRQTVSRYLSDYERTSTVSDPDAQMEFDRLMASEMQRLKEQDGDYKLELIKARRENLSSEKKINDEEYKRLLLELINNHPDVTIYDSDGNPVERSTIDFENNWISPWDNEELINSLTESEKSRWEQLLDKAKKTNYELFRNGRIEQACILEKIWDCTEPRGKPIIYDDEFECVISEEEAGAELYNFRCDSFCLCNDNTARIYAEKLFIPEFEHNVEVEVLAIIEVITDKGMYHMETVKLEPQSYVYRYIGQIDNLVPGYKYVYSLSISAGDYDEVNEREYTLLEGYYAKESHPLK